MSRRRLGVDSSDVLESPRGTHYRPHLLETELDLARIKEDWAESDKYARRILEIMSVEEADGQNNATKIALAAANCALAETCMQRKRWTDAKAYVEKALALRADFEDALYLSALQCLLVSSSAAAEEAALTTISRLDWTTKHMKEYWRSDDARTHTPYRWGLLLRALHLRAHLLERSGKLPEASYAYTEVWRFAGATRGGKYGPPRPLLAVVVDALAAQARVSVLLNRPDSAQDFARLVVLEPASHPLDVRAHVQFMLMYSKLLVLACSERDFRPVVGASTAVSSSPKTEEENSSTQLARDVLRKKVASNATVFVPRTIEEEAYLALEWARVTLERLQAAQKQGAAATKHKALFEPSAGDEEQKQRDMAQPTTERGQLLLSITDAPSSDMLRELESALCLILLRVRRIVGNSESASVVSLCRTAVSTKLQSGAHCCRTDSKIQLRHARFEEALEAASRAVECLSTSEPVTPALEAQRIRAMLLACKVCVNELGGDRMRAEEGVEWARKALTAALELEAQLKTKAVTSGGDIVAAAVLARVTVGSLVNVCRQSLGVACSHYAFCALTFAERKKLQQTALECLNRVLELEPGAASRQDVLFRLGLLHADTRDIASALQYTRRSLDVDSSHAPSWVLLALLLSSRKQFMEVLKATKMGLSLCKSADQGSSRATTSDAGNVSGRALLLLVRGQAYAHLGDFDQSVESYSQVIELAIHSGEMPQTEQDTFLITDVFTTDATGQEKVIRRRRPIFRRFRDSSPSSQRPQTSGPCIGLDVLRQVLLSVGSLYHSHALAHAHVAKVRPKPRPNADSKEAELSTEDFDLTAQVDQDGKTRLLLDAYDCVHMAHHVADRTGRSTTASTDHAGVHAVLAQFLWAEGDVEGATRHFESALAVQSNHVPSLVGLGALHAWDGTADGTPRVDVSSPNLSLAFGYLSSALEVDAACHEAWYEMGLVLRRQNKPAAASDHLLTALDLERTAPILPFSILAWKV